MKFNAESYHKPVLLEKAAEYLVSSKKGLYLDCTSGGGGHAEFLLKNYPGIKLVGIDCDSYAIEACQSRLAAYKGRYKILRGNFRNAGELLSAAGYENVDGVLADLGVSSFQFDEKSRGFSFESETLDMRMDNSQSLTAAEIVNQKSLDELSQIFLDFGEERRARIIAQAIVEARNVSPFVTGKQLSDCVERRIHRTGKIHPATRIFQALRIAVNDEMGSLESLLKQLPGILSKGARAAVISYHSLEDRLVKQYFKLGSVQGYYKLVNKNVLIPAYEEIRNNRRARSAKMRVAEKC